MIQQRILKVFSLIFVICLIVTMFNLPVAAESATNTITLGGTIDSDPLKIDVLDNGRLGFYFWQQVGSDHEFQHQYYGDDSWGTNLFFTRNETDIHYSTDYYQDWYGDPEAGEDTGLGTLVKSGNSVTGTWLLDEGRITFKQIISYLPGSYMYEKTFSLTNNTTDTTYSNLKIIHGGDTYFGGDDDSSSYWNELLNMIYLRNADMELYGLMGFAGMASTPADRYFGGEYDDGAEEAMAGNLSNFADPDYIDAGYQLQWNHGSLAPGASWTIHSYEMITEPSALQIISPSARSADPGDVVDFSFEVINFSSEERIINLQANSEHSWTTAIEGGNQVTLAEDGGSATVIVHVTVPADATPLMIDTLKLTATDSEHPESTVTGSTRININQQLPKIVSITPEHEVIYQGTGSLNVAIKTSNTDDNTPIDIALFDTDMNPITPSVVVSGVIVSNGASLSLTLPADLPTGQYKILATLTGAAETKSANLSIISRPVITTVKPDTRIVVQGDKTLNITISTNYLPAGSIVSLMVLDSNKMPFSPAITGSGQVANDGSVSILLALPADIPLGKYFLQTSAQGAEDHTDASFTVIADSSKDIPIENIPKTGETGDAMPIAVGFSLLVLSGCYFIFRRERWA